MASDGRLVVVESFLGRVGQEREDDIADTQGAIVDLHMLVVAGGRERSISEYVGLLRQAGLATFRIRADGSSGGLLAGFYPSQAASPSEGGLFSGVALGNAAR